jgi:hypothetical protein
MVADCKGFESDFNADILFERSSERLNGDDEKQRITKDGKEHLSVEPF